MLSVLLRRQNVPTTERGYASPGANHSRCVKTERRRRGSRRPHSAALRGVFRGFRKKIP